MRESRSYDPELYRKVKESVTMQQAVEYCGLRVIKDKCLCPFHKDQHPSMKIYPDGKGYYCFACGSGGDQVKFVARYLGVNNYDAAKELAQAFGIPIEEPVTYREKREAEKKKRCRREKDEFSRYAEEMANGVPKPPVRGGQNAGQAFLGGAGQFIVCGLPA